MKIVIDIDEDVFTRLFDNGTEDYAIVNDDLFAIAKAIRKGTPLPKGCSRLISADSLIRAIEEKAKRLSNTDTINGLCGAVALIFDAPTVIEADKEE